MTDLLPANPTRGHKDVSRSTGHTVVTTRYSNQQGPKHDPCQVQPTESIGTLSASRRCLKARAIASTVLSVTSISESEVQATEERLSDVLSCPFSKVIKSDHMMLFFYLSGGNTKASSATLYRESYRQMPTRIIKAPYFISRANQIDLGCCRGLPTASVLSKKADKFRSNQFDQQAQVFQYHASCRNKKKCNTEVHGGGSLELVMKPAREPASSRPKPGFDQLFKLPHIIKLISKARSWSQDRNISSGRNTYNVLSVQK